MSFKHALRPSYFATALSLILIAGVVSSESFSAPAPTPAPAPAASPFGRLVPVAPVAPASAPAPTAAPFAGPTTAPAATASAAPAAAGPAGASPAVAQPRIVVIDRQLILQRSAAGKEMVTQTQNLSKQAETQFRTEEAALQGEAVQLQQQMAILAADVRAQKEKDFTAKQQAFQTRVQQRQAQIQTGFNNAARQLEVALDPILQTIMRERGANMVLDRSAVIVAAADIDVTGIAVQRLDRALPHVKVELGQAPAAPVAGAAPAAPAAAAAPPAAAPRPAAPVAGK